MGRTKGEDGRIPGSQGGVGTCGAGFHNAAAAAGTENLQQHRLGSQGLVSELAREKNRVGATQSRGQDLPACVQGLGPYLSSRANDGMSDLSLAPFHCTAFRPCSTRLLLYSGLYLAMRSLKCSTLKYIVLFDN